MAMHAAACLKSGAEVQRSELLDVPQCAFLEVAAFAEGIRRFGLMRGFALLVCAILIGNQSAQAQEAFEARQGLALARRVCSDCHGIVPGAPSAVAGAPNFQTIARSPGMSPLALRVALETPHHSMPNLMLTADELRNITAYIMGLR